MERVGTSTDDAPTGRRAWTSLRAGAAAPFVALRVTARDPSMLRLQLAWAAVMVASWATTVSLSVVAWTEGGSLWVAAAVVARTVPSLVAGPLVGWLADRLPRSRSLFWAAAVSALGAAGAAVAGRTVVVVVVLAALVAVATMLFRTALVVTVPELVDEPSELTTANVLASATESFGVFAGPALAGLLLAVQGPQSAFACAAVLFVVAAVLVLGLRPRSSQVPAPAPTATGVRDLLAHRPARLMYLLVLLQTVVAGGLVVLYPSLAVDGLGLDVSAAGLLNSAYGLGGVLGSLGLFALAGSFRLGLAAAWAMLLWSVPLLLLPLAPGLPLVLGLLLLVGGGNVLFDVTVTTLLQRSVPSHLLGRAFGTMETVIVLGLGLGAVAAPGLEAALGPMGALAVLAAPLGVAAVLTVRPLRRLDRELAAPSRQVALLRSSPAFSSLPTLQLERLALSLDHHEVVRGGTATRQGDPGTAWFVVDDGELDVDVDGRVVRRIGPGDAFGEIALLREGVRTATVTARTDAVLWSLDGQVFLAALGAGNGRGLAAVDAVVDGYLAHAAPRSTRR